ncbi:MAG: AMP-binding protein [Candidatus Poribacteria bacterium]|nr:AMP-binding protein [Candidatus Poribacteria bacterium]MDE0504128.1 AMP-binding protein [Candidatus Poribacteria bacterium]
MATQLNLEHLLQCGLDRAGASKILQKANPLLSSLSPPECWRRIVDEVLTPAHPFALHKLLHDCTFANWNTARDGPAPAWFPSNEQVQRANITGLMKEMGIGSYRKFHAWSVENRANFFEMMVNRLNIRFGMPFEAVVELSRGAESPHWLPGAALNIADSCFGASGDAPAIVSKSENTSLSTMTYSELDSLSNRVANSLVETGFTPGDSIAVDMPMTPESVAIYLGIIKAGCTVVSVADSFAPHEIETRLNIADTKAIFTQDCIPRGCKRLPLYEKVVAAGAPRAVVLSSGREADSPTELRPEDVTWDKFLSQRVEFKSVACHPHGHTNILFSSGTTGAPKAIPWTHTTPIKCAIDAFLHHDIKPGDVLAWPTNLGWMMGPWLIYASLINKGTMALYDGSPTERAFGEFVQDASVAMLGVVPSLVRAWKNTECMKGLDWSKIKAFSSTGECSNPEDMLFLMSLAEYKPIIEYCGGTEIGGGFITGTLLQPSAPATFTTPALGSDLVILDVEGKHTENGEVFLIPPSMGLSTELLKFDHHEVYFEGNPTLPDTAPLRRHGDQIERLAGGYYRAHGRVDDTMNLGGIKVSSAEIEQVLNTVSGVRETAAVAVSPKDGGPSQLTIHAVLLTEAYPDDSSLRAAFRAAIREQLNPLFKIHDVVVRDSLPRTASNKIMRRLLRGESTE